MADDKLFPHKTSRGESLGRRGGIAKRHIRIGAIGYSELSKDLAFDLSFARTQAEVVQAAKEVWDRAAAITEDGKFLVERLQGFIERNQLSLDVRQELDDAASRLSEAEQRLFGVEGQVENIETSIEELEDKIVLKVDKEELDALAKRVVDVEAELSVQAGEIQLRATKEELNTLELRVQEAEAQLSVHSEEIAAKVNRSEFDLLSGQVATNTANISATADLISSEIARIEANLNSTNRELWYSSIRQAADLITSEVARIEEALNGSNPELWYSSIKQAWDRIESTVAVLNLDADHPQQFSSIKQTADEISSIVTTLNEKSPTDAGQFSSIRQTANQIASVVATLEKDPHDTTQYSAIRQMAGEIDLRVRNDQVISAINISPEEVKIQANRVMIGSPAQGLPQGAHLFHFDNSLQSTRGVRPLSGHVATLRPGEGRFGGAVAVEEATQNLIALNKEHFYKDGHFELLTPTGFVATFNGTSDWWDVIAWDLTLSPGTYTIQFDVTSELSQGFMRFIAGPLTQQSGGYPSDYTGIQVVADSTRGKRHYEFTFQVTNGSVPTRIAFHKTNYAAGIVRVENLQLENKPFATSFVDGTRAGGKLDYNLPLTNPHTGHLWMYAPYRIESVYYGGAAKDNSPLFELIDEATGYHLEFETYRNRPFIDPVIGTYTSHMHNDWIPEAHTWYGVTWKLLPDNFVVEVRDVSGNLIQTWDAPSSEFAGFHPTQLRLGVFGGAVLIDELLILPYAASEEEIRAWYELKAPFYDTDDRVAADLPGGHVITFDSSGMQMQPHNVPQRTMHLDGKMLGFWDPNGEPSIGIGDVREMAQHFNSTMQYGLLLAQGEIRATESVLRESFISGTIQDIHLAPGTVNNSVIADESVDGDKLVPGTVGLYQLNEFLQVPSTSTITLRRYGPTGSGSVRLNTSDWHTVVTATVAKRSESQGYVMEACKVNFEARAGNPFAVARLQVNGVPVASFDIAAAMTLYGAVIDTRTLPDGNVSFLLEAMRKSSTVTLDHRNFTIYQNDQLPIRWGKPHYTFEGAEVGGCFETCEVTCESKCQKTCQTSCQSKCQSNCQTSCQEACQKSCQSTCQKTSQGGGCLRDGTPITIWDPDTKEYLEIPIEELKPGMILPAYNPVTDSIEHGELIELIDALYSHKFIRIHTDVGPSVDVTYSQPFDVLADLGHGLQWYKVQAKYLKPGMKMARPFDDPDKRIATITKVEEVVERNTHFWNLRTSHGRFIAAGYADQTKMPY